MKARFVRGAETRQRIIQVAADLFHKQGVRAPARTRSLKPRELARGSFITISKARRALSTRFFRPVWRRSRAAPHRSNTKSLPGRIWSSGFCLRWNSKRALA